MIFDFSFFIISIYSYLFFISVKEVFLWEEGFMLGFFNKYVSFLASFKLSVFGVKVRFLGGGVMLGWGGIRFSLEYCIVGFGKGDGIV